MTESIKPSTSLTTPQIVTLALFGALLWFVAAMLVRFLAPMGALEGVSRALTYALVIPGTVPFVLMTRAVAKLARDQTAVGIMVVTAAALLLDGIAHAWFPAIYGSDPTLWVGGAAVIFWGAGVGLVLGLVMNGRG
jgi:hypothetical protein